MFATDPSKGVDSAEYQQVYATEARTYPLEQVRDAFRELAARHSHGKIVLLP